MAETVKVELKSAWWSKINWTQVVQIAASLATFAGLVVPPDLIPQALVVINGVAGLATIVMKTYFTNSVTPESVK